MLSAHTSRNHKRGWLVAGYVGLGLLLPHSSQAAVYFSEIAWMGGLDSANDEWIELHNSGQAAVDVTDWQLTDGGSFNVVLGEAGAIGAGQYAVLERTDDSSAPGSAFYVYTGALANGGATLRLYNTAGQLVDQVAGGENWENIGGDNTTKETAQYTNSVWQTANPTPGSANTARANTNDTEEETDTISTQSTSGGTVVSRSRNTSRASGQNTSLEIDVSSTGYVAQSIDFAPQKRRGEWTHTGHDFWWNFGDGTVSDSREASHAYSHPGRYIVVLAATRDGEEELARQEITILPVTLEITRNRAGEVQVSNTAQYEVDISGNTLVAADTSITFPPHTYLLANQTITIPNEVAALPEQAVVAVHNPAGRVITYQVPRGDTPAVSSPTLASAGYAAPSPSEPVATAPETASRFLFSSNAATGSVATTSSAPPETPPPTTQAATVIQSAEVTSANDSWLTRQGMSYAAFGGVLLLTLLALYARRYQQG